MLPNKKNLWSTPTAFDAHNIKGERKKSSGGQIEPLQQQVRMWPTPSAQQAGDGDFIETLQTKDGKPAEPGQRAYNPKTGKHSQITLNRAVKMWPTPQAKDHDLEPLKKWKKRSKKKKEQGINLQFALRHAVQMWPTPRVSDTEGGVVKNVELNNGNFSRTNKKGVRWGVKLKDAVSHVEMLPTPAARDWKGGRKPETLKKAGRNENNSLPDKVNAQLQTTGALNPDWVEWLMGYGQGYTDPDNKDSFTLGSHQGFAIEPDTARVTTENQYRKNRLKALGNSIVPQIAYHIGNAILEQEGQIDARSTKRG